ncbi:hypothetical protein [uncultured Methylobacterium sp.]|jgi:hypothetical protein|uniref:hypothetical protein n=1 Tax=uncultured Methylobacterium sp. TaxID=157278 RepID=UPI00261B1BF2|nr:hypothetical protein [uncultured Methylobacterium sp.]
MSSHYQPTIVSPFISKHLVTPLEMFLLEQMFEVETSDDGCSLYLFAEEHIQSTIDATDPDFVKNYLTDESPLGIRFQADYLSAGSSDEFDLTTISYTDVFQAIITRHSAELPYVSLEKAYTCTRMEPGQFGGRAEFITATDVHHVDTGEWLNDKINEIKSVLKNKV